MPAPRSGQLQRRQNAMSSGSTTAFLAVGGVVVVLVLILVLSSYIRSRRLKSDEPPGFVPRFLHARWKRWQPGGYRNLHPPSRGSGGGDDTSLDARISSDLHSSAVHEGEIDRRRSVRSILTLPPYHVAPLPSERLIAREGERAGVDVVVEFPESEAEIEARREEEMATLYRIRETRRREDAEREERRQQRRAARSTGNWALLEQLEQESRDRAHRRAAEDTILARATTEPAESTDPAAGTAAAPAAPAPSSRYLIAELTQLREANQRSRRVSSVSYAELGLARHDGSRLRADSVDSRDDAGLIDGAAAMGRRSRAVSRAGSDDAGRAGSVASHYGSAANSGPPSRAPSAARAGTPSVARPPPAHANTSLVSLRHSDDAARASPRLLTPQRSMEMQPPDPPSYDDDLSVHGGEAPPYESPVQTRAPPLPSTAALAQATGTADEWQADADLAASYVALGPDGEEYSGSSERHDMQREATDREARTPTAAGARTAPSLAPLQTDSPQLAPALQVTSATPVSSVPPTPTVATGPAGR